MALNDIDSPALNSNVFIIPTDILGGGGGGSASCLGIRAQKRMGGETPARLLSDV